eukprot:SAG22_NODE_2750_length_2251_cov_1.424721_2_plen_157_part_00
MPNVADAVLIIDPVVGSTDTTTLAGFGSGDYKWLGAVLGPNGKIYGIPCNADAVLIIDPVAGSTDTTTMAGFGIRNGKWNDGVLGLDGKIYGMPDYAGSVLTIDPVAGSTDTTTLAFQSTFQPWLNSGDKWYGGVLAPDGKIYGIPADVDAVVIIL